MVKVVKTVVYQNR